MKYIVLAKVQTAVSYTPYWTGYQPDEEPALEVAADTIRRMYGDDLKMLLDIRVKAIPDYLDVSFVEEERLIRSQEEGGCTVYVPTDAKSSTSNTLIWQIIALVSQIGLLVMLILRML